MSKKKSKSFQEMTIEELSGVKKVFNTILIMMMTISGLALLYLVYLLSTRFEELSANPSGWLPFVSIFALMLASGAPAFIQRKKVMEELASRE